MPFYRSGGGPDFSGVKVARSADLSIAGGTDTAISWDAESWDTDSYHDTSVNPTRLTVPKAGYYNIAAKAHWATDTTNQRLVGYRLNGGTTVWLGICAAVTNFGTVQSVSVDRLLAAGDYVEIMVHQNSGGALALTPALISGSMTYLGS